jgi:hypothetical protein
MEDVLPLIPRQQRPSEKLSVFDSHGPCNAWPRDRQHVLMYSQRRDARAALFSFSQLSWMFVFRQQQRLVGVSEIELVGVGPRERAVPTRESGAGVTAASARSSAATTSVMEGRSQQTGPTQSVAMEPT